MNVDRVMLVEAVLDGKLSSEYLRQSDIDDYQFLIDTQTFEFAIADAFESNPSLTFSEVEYGWMN